MKIKKVGILTGGGDCPGLNAVLRAFVKSAVDTHGWEVVGFRDGYRGLVENWTVPLTESSVSGILNRGGTVLGANNRSSPFVYTYGPRGETVPPQDRSRQVIAQLKESRIDALALLGGDGTLTSGLKLFKLGLPLVGVPKTIDNDLMSTDVTFGFDTALAVATEAIDRVRTTAESHHRVMVIETMGRHAGWIALRSGIASGADVILIPEIPYHFERVLAAVQARAKLGKHFTIIVASEGAVNQSGEMVVERMIKGSPQPIHLGGVAKRLADDMEARTGIESRATVLGYLQRGGTPTAYDRWLATRFGTKATDMLAAGEFGKMAALRGADIESVPLERAVHQLKLVDPNGAEVRTARSIGVSFGD